MNHVEIRNVLLMCACVAFMLFNVNYLSFLLHFCVLVWLLKRRVSCCRLIMLRPLQVFLFFEMFLWVLQIVWLMICVYIKLSESYGTTTMRQRNTNRSLFHHIHLPAKENHLKNRRPGPVHLSSHILLSVFIFHTHRESVGVFWMPALFGS